MDKQNEIFASNLKMHRRRLGLTQRALADLIGYTEKSVSKWESGIAIVPSAVLPILAKILNVSIDSLFVDSSAEHYYLGIDGGGTKTEFALADKSGNVISRTVLEGCNPVDVGISKALEILDRGIRMVCADIPCSLVSVFAGLAGGITGENKERVHDFLCRYGFASVGNGSDAENAVALALGDGEGTAVIMGTGSIAFTRTRGELVRRGGYGYLMDDGGSGFSIGRDALIAALRADEQRGPETALLEIFKEELGVKKMLDSIGALYAGGKRKVAALAPLVFKAAQDGDGVALSILEGNMKAIAELVEGVAYTKGEKRKVVLLGGLTAKSDMLVPMILSHLKNPSEYTVKVDKRAPILGALRLAGANIDKENENA